MLKNYIKYIIKKKKTDLKLTKLKKKSKTESKKSENFSDQIILLEPYNMNTMNQEQMDQQKQTQEHLGATQEKQWVREEKPPIKNKI